VRKAKGERKMESKEGSKGRIRKEKASEKVKQWGKQGRKESNGKGGQEGK
jgi:hypothetical protein